jgi:toxin ParE1/3/4
MTGKPAHVLPQAVSDLRQATAWYRKQSGEALALRWVEAVSAALGHVAAHPRAGASRYAVALNLGGLRFWPVQTFPYLIFYIEREAQVDVWRVLHSQRDVPEWMRELQ